MGLIRGMFGLGMLVASFYGGYKANEFLKPHIVVEQKCGLEQCIKSMLDEDPAKVQKYLLRVGREYGFEK